MKQSRQILIAAALTVLMVTASYGGTITGGRTGATEARVGTITGSRTGTITGSRTGTITGSRGGTITGSRSGVSQGSGSLERPLGSIQDELLLQLISLVLAASW
jgi:hypothetical protein